MNKFTSSLTSIRIVIVVGCLALLTLASISLGIGRDRVSPAGGRTSDETTSPTVALQLDAIDPSHRAAIEVFVGGVDLPIQDRGLQEGVFGLVHEYQVILSDGDWALIRVDPNRLEVCGFLRQEPRRAVQIGTEEAERIATEFARMHYEGFEETRLVQTQAGLTQQGERPLYLYDWVQVDAESGAMLPRMVHVAVDGVTGEVVVYNSLREELTVSTQPAISEEEAGEIALRRVQEKWGGGEIREVQLAISTLPVGASSEEQTLLWGVTVTMKDEGSGPSMGEGSKRQEIVTILVDAHSGEVIGGDE